MIIGSTFTGQVKTQNRQYIETKVFIFLIPLQIESTLLVTGLLSNGRVGIEIKTNTTSILASIFRFIISLVAFFSIGSYLGNYGNSTWAWLIIPAVISFLLLIYFWFFFGRTTKKEAFIRKQFGKETGLYFIPKWLKHKDLIDFFTELKKKYEGKFDDENWSERLTGVMVKDKNFSLFYCLTALEGEINNNMKKKDLISKITDKYYKK